MNLIKNLNFYFMGMSKGEKKFYTSYSKLAEVKLITIGLASPERIKQWAEKTLPNGKILGEVRNANTLHHKTFKPQKGGLFCERIFGPLKDFECACGKTLKNKKSSNLKNAKTPLFLNLVQLRNPSLTSAEIDPNKSILGNPSIKTRNFCNICEVEYTWSVMRRYQLGFIQLISPITHIWYLKGNPSYLSILLDIKKRHLEYITYCSESLTIENVLKGKSSYSNSSDIVSSWNKLKKQIILEKATKFIKLTGTKKNDLKKYLSSTPKIENKIKKRDQLKIKKQNFWKKIVNNQSFLSLSSHLNPSPSAVHLKGEEARAATAARIGCYRHPFGKGEAGIAGGIEKRSSKINGIKKMSKLKNENVSIFNPLPLKMFLIGSPLREEKEFFSKPSKISLSSSSSPYPRSSKNLLGEEGREMNDNNSNVIKNLQYHFNKINLTTLLRLCMILNQIKQTKLNNNFETIVIKNQSAKQILKSLSIPCYILFKINQTNKILLENLIKKTWTIFFQKAIKSAIFRINKILKKVDSIFYRKLLSNYDINKKVLTNSDSETLKADLFNDQKVTFSIKNLKLARESLKLIKNYVYILIYDSLINSDFLDPIDRFDSNKNINQIIKNGEFHFQASLTHGSAVAAPEVKAVSYPFNVLSNTNITPNLPEISSDKVNGNAANITLSNFRVLSKKSTLSVFKNESLYRLLTTGDQKVTQFPAREQTSAIFDVLIRNKKVLLKSGLYLKFYTLSKFKNKNLELILNNKISYKIFNLKESKKLYKILFNKLSNFFFNIFLKNNSLNFKKIRNLQRGAEGLKNDSLNSLISEKQKKEFFDQILKNFYLKQIRNEKFISTSLSQNLDNLQEKSWQGKNFPSVSSESESNSKSEFGTHPPIFCQEIPISKNFDLNKEKIVSKNLYNNIYSLSHRERWESENDWNFLDYFMTAPTLTYSQSEFDVCSNVLIPNYKNHYKNIISILSNDLSFSNIGGITNLQKSASTYFSGSGIVQQLLIEFNFYEIKKMDKQNRILLYQLNKQIIKLKPYSKHNRIAKKELKEGYKKRDFLIRRTKLIRKLFVKESVAQSTILTILPVLPPDLRPIVKMGGQIAASDLNRLYQRVIYRNDRLKKFLKDPATSHSYEMKYAQRLLQEAVDNLIQNGKSGVVSEKDSRGRALKSLSDILKGKQGRFRQYLLGKRVDYSGRSVIVVGPQLKLHECGIPKEMALELYLPFLLKRILNENLAKTVVGAKTILKTNPSLTWELLREIMQTCPVLLNRAPTLHRLGIQSFQPKLIDGRAILLHPLVCSAFNADFDGDQMAVHVPITIEARAEAWKLMLSRNNILSPATGEPLAIPSQDMVLGCYYLTTNLLNKKTQNLTNRPGSGFYYSTWKNILRDYDLKKIDLHANIWLKWNHLIENGMDQEETIEIRINQNGNWKEISNQIQRTFNNRNRNLNQYILTTPGKILFNQVIQNALN